MKGNSSTKVTYSRKGFFKSNSFELINKSLIKILDNN